jgi:hypothetical protein
MVYEKVVRWVDERAVLSVWLWEILMACEKAQQMDSTTDTR